MSEESVSLPLPLPLPVAGGWDGALLEPVAELNERVLASLQARALAVREAAGRHGPSLLGSLGADWAALRPDARQRLASCPYLLLDLGLPGPAPAHDHAVHEVSAGAGYFPGAEGTALLRRALMFGWHVARSNAVAARVLLGMSGAAVQGLARCRLQALEALAERAGEWAMPRWADRVGVWRQLLRAAGGPGEGMLRAAQLRGLQLLAAQVG